MIIWVYGKQRRKWKDLLITLIIKILTSQFLETFSQQYFTGLLSFPSFGIMLYIIFYECLELGATFRCSFKHLKIAHFTKNTLFELPTEKQTPKLRMILRMRFQWTLKLDKITVSFYVVFFFWVYYKMKSNDICKQLLEQIPDTKAILEHMSHLLIRN